MPGISIHAVDIARGQPASGMQVDLYALDDVRKLLATGRLSANGALDHAILQDESTAGRSYEVVFHVGDYFRATGAQTSTPPFLDLVPFCFTVADATQHYHLPFKFTPWGFSLFRGN